MAHEKTDRRVKKTKAILLQGLIQLMQEKEIKNISVKELTDLVDINRSTFYLHYRDIFDMADQIEADLFQEFDQILRRNMAEKAQLLSPYTIFLEIFSFLERNREVAQALCGPHGDLGFVNRLKDLVKEHLNDVLDKGDASTENEYYSAFAVSGYTGIIEIWLNHPEPSSAAEMAELCEQLVQPQITG